MNSSEDAASQRHAETAEVSAQPRRSPTGPDPHALLQLPPWRAIVQLAAPTTLVMVIAATSSVLYTFYVSRLGTEAIAAVSLVFPISLLAITAMAGGIGSGASSAIARALGAGQRSNAARVAEHAMVLSVGLGIAFALGMFVGARPLFRLMGGTGAVLDRATLFARILYAGSVISFAGAMLDSVMRGEGNVRVSSIWSSASLILQMALTPLFMFTAGMGLAGAPLAVLTSQFLATFPRARHVFGGHGVVHPAWWPTTLATAPLREILRVGIPASLATTINYVGIIVLTGVVARLGDTHLAAYGLGTRLDFLLLSFAFGFGAAVLTLVGMATGARRPDRAATYVVRAGLLMVALLAVAGAILWWRPSMWLGLFTQDPGIHQVGSEYLRIIGPSYPFVGIAMVLGFAFQGLGRATAPLVLAVVRVTVVVGAAVLVTQVFGGTERAVFAVVAIGNVLSAAAMTLLFARLHRATARAVSPAAAAVRLASDSASPP